MRILLASANREKVPYPVLPVGLASVASALEEEGHEVSFLDLCFSRDPERDLAARIARAGPDLVGLGLRNLDNCDFSVPRSFVPEARGLVEACRRASKAPVVIGGAAVGVMPEELMSAVGADFAVAGDGEAASAALARALGSGGGFESVPGLLWRGPAGGIRRNPPRPAPLLDAHPFPRVYRWADVGAYLRYEGVYPLQSKRGCALQCTYCTYVNIEGRRYRFRSGESVADEVAEIHERAGVADFEFVDSTFNAPPSHAMEVCRAIARRRLPVRFIGNGMNPVATTPALLAEMKAAGFTSLVSTAESASDAVLANLRKGFTRTHLEGVARSTRAAGLPVLWIFLLGGPGETAATVKETLDFFGEAAGPGDVAFVAGGIRIYPDTPLAETAREEGFYRDRSELLEPRFYFSPSLDRGDLRRTLRARAKRDPRIVTSERTQAAWVPAGLRLLSFLGVRKPFWRFAPVLNRALRWAG